MSVLRGFEVLYALPAAHIDLCLLHSSAPGIYSAHAHHLHPSGNGRPLPPQWRNTRQEIGTKRIASATTGSAPLIA